MVITLICKKNNVFCSVTGKGSPFFCVPALVNFRRKIMDNQNKKNSNNNRQGWGVILITTLLVTFVVMGLYSFMRGSSPEEISYDEFLDLVEDKKVEEVQLGSNRIYITLTDRAREEEQEDSSSGGGGITSIFGQIQNQAGGDGSVRKYW